MVEILVAAVITVIITAAAVQVYLTQHRTYLWQEQISDMNMNAQFAIDELTKRFTYAGYGIPNGTIIDSIDHDTITEPLLVKHNPDTLTIISKTPIHGVYGIVAVPNVYASDPIQCYGYSDSLPSGHLPMDLDANDWAIIAHQAPCNYLNETFQVSSINKYDGYYNTITRVGSWTSPGFGGGIVGSYVTKIEYYKYYLDTLNHNIMLATRSDPETVVVVPNVDSLNFTYKYHLSLGDRDLDTLLPGAFVEAINVRLTVRTERTKRDVYGTGTGGYAYKTFSATIMLRNKGIVPRLTISF